MIPKLITILMGMVKNPVKGIKLVVRAPLPVLARKGYGWS